MGKCDPLFPPGTYEFYRALISTIVCVVGAALAAGLTMGLISLNEMDLLILLETREEECETEEERTSVRSNKAYAAKVLPLVREHHYLLVTLLLLNCLCNESLPLFLDSLVPSWVAIMLAVSLILMFGEIVPSAVFTGEHGLRISATLSPLVYFAMFVLFPVAYPISAALDKSLPHATNKYSKAEVLALLRLHVKKDGEGGEDGEQQQEGERTELDVRENEVRIIKGALGLRNTKVGEIVSHHGLFMVSEDAVLDHALLREIAQTGHSRIPVHTAHNRHDICGLLLTKHLTCVGPEDGKLVKEMPLREPTFCHPDDTLASVLQRLRIHRHHLAIVTNNPLELQSRFAQGTYCYNTTSSLEEVAVEVFGVVTLLNVLERLVDETLVENEDEYYHHHHMDEAKPVGRWAVMRRQNSSRGSGIMGSANNSDLNLSLLSH